MNKKLRIWAWLPAMVLLAWAIAEVPVSRSPLPVAGYSAESLAQSSSSFPFSEATFSDVTLLAGIQRPHTQRSEYLSGIHESIGAGACAFDYDRDGWLDLLTLNGSGTTHYYGKPQWWQQSNNSLTLYANNRDGTFKDVTAASGLISNGWTMGCAAADLDNDGDTDLFIGNYGDNQLWRNNGDGSFTDVTRESGQTGNGWSTTISVVDVNQDGLLDLYVSNYLDFTTNSLTFEKSTGFESAMPGNFDPVLYSGQPNQLMLNQGNLRFTDVAGQFGIANSQGRSLFSHWFDIDANGFPDLIVANDRGSANKVFLNQNGSAFNDFSTESRLAFADRASYVGQADFDNDGGIELFVSTDNSLFPRLYSWKAALSEEGKPYFKDVSDSYEIQNATTISLSHWGGVTADFNLDGWTDIFIANGIPAPDQNARLLPRGQINSLLINDGGKRFLRHDTKIAAGTYPSISSRCAMAFDFNNDGATDIYLTNNNGLGQLLLNAKTRNQWIGVEILSAERTAYGASAIVKLPETDDELVRQQFVGRSSFLCNGDQRLVFGLGRIGPESPIELSITWPDGQKRNYKNLLPNRYYTAHKEGDEIQASTKSNTTHSSKISLTQAAHKLTVIAWLIRQGRTALATKELSLLMQHADARMRLAALETSLQLPVTFKNAILQQAISDRSAEVRIAAIGTIRDSENELFNRWLLRQLDHDDTRVACKAAQSFAHFFDEEEAMLLSKYTAMSALIRLAQGSESKRQICAIDALGRSERYRALQPLIDLLGSSDREVRLAAVKGLGLLKEKAAIKPLQNLFLSRTESPANRAQALVAMKQIDVRTNIRSLLARAANMQGVDAADFESIVRHAVNRADNRIVIRNDMQAFVGENKMHRLMLVEKPIQREDTTNARLPAGVCEDSYELVPEVIDEYLSRCLSEDTFYKDMPPAIKTGLEGSDFSVRQAIFSRIASRKERWARDLTESALSNDALPVQLRRLIIQSLAEKMPAGLSKILLEKFRREPNSELAPYIAKRLIEQGNLEIAGIVLEQLKLNLDQGNHDKALLYAAALVEHEPRQVIDLLINE